jgi:(R,R)-butanediol dehydrogenase/meso-butanediol dehydrogenase/diacetyl reductase
MTEMVRGAVLVADKKAEIQERAMKEMGPRDGVVKVEFCGICGSDLHAWSAGGAIFPYGTLMGHEAVGTIEKVGSEVKTMKAGDRVAVNGFKPCGECVACRSGMVNACVHNMVNTIGNSPNLDGAFADRVYLPDIDVTAVKIPDHLSAQHGAFTEPAATGVHAIRISKYRVGDSVAVVGAGPIGLLVTAGLKAAGAGQIIVSQRPGARADLAMKFGATHTINPRDENVSVGDQIRAINEVGADVVIECAGAPAALQQSIDMARPRGQVILVGVNEMGTPITPTSLMFGEIEIKGSLAWDHRDFKIAVDFMQSGDVNVEPLLSDIVALDDIQAKGFEALKSDKSLIKVLVKP